MSYINILQSKLFVGIVVVIWGGLSTTEKFLYPISFQMQTLHSWLHAASEKDAANSPRPCVSSGFHMREDGCPKYPRWLTEGRDTQADVSELELGWWSVVIEPSKWCCFEREAVGALS